MKKLTVAILLASLALASCKPAGNPGSHAADADSMTSGGPDVNVTAAPGVAFTYEYEFHLAASRIAQLQEVHAQACEALGAARCRITALHYSAGSDPKNVSGRLTLALDPRIARQFGKQGIEAVVKAGGRLSQADIKGVDAGAAIRQIDARTAQARTNLANAESKLANLPPNARERAGLQEAAQQAQETIDNQSAQRTEQVQTLATTPVTFDYAASQGWFGADNSPPLVNALGDGLQAMTWAAMAVIVVVGAALPWLVLILLLRFIYVRVQRRRAAQDESA